MDSDSSYGPDGASAWVVAFAVCMINLIMAGLGRMSGILFVAFIELFGVDRKTASTPFSIRSSTGNLLGPVVGILGQKYGVRKVAVIGGILSTVSAASCFYAQDMFTITILWGIFNGIGSSLVVTLPQVTIGQYFHKYHSTASGMAFSGGCIGSLIFPGILDLLLFHFGLSGTFLFIAGIIMHTIPAAMILRKPSWLKTKVIKPVGDVASIIIKGPIKEAKSPCIESNAVKSSGRRVGGKPPNWERLQKKKDLVLKMLSLCKSHDPEKFKAFLVDELDTFLQGKSLNGELEYHADVALSKNGLVPEKLKKELVSCAGSEWENHLNVAFRNRSMPDLSLVKSLSHDALLNAVKELLKLDPAQVSSALPGESKGVAKTLKDLRRLYDFKTKFDLDVAASPNPSKDASEDSSNPPQSVSIRALLLTALELHTRPIFLLICLCRVVHFVTFIPVLTTVVDFVIDKGMREEAGKWAIAALSVGDLLGRLCFGWVTDKGFLTVPKFMLTVMIAQGLSTISLPMMDTKFTLFSMLGVFGMLQGSLLIRHPILVLRYTRSHEQAIAMGCTNFFSGLLGIALPLYIGYFRDTLGSYDYIFYINGVVGALVGMLWILEPYFMRCQTPKLATPDRPPV